MFRVQFLCPRQSPNWQDLTEPYLWVLSRPRQYSTLNSAYQMAVGLIWRYHSVRVLNDKNQVVFEA